MDIFGGGHYFAYHGYTAGDLAKKKKNSIFEDEYVIRTAMGSTSQSFQDLLKQSCWYLAEQKGKNKLKIKESVQRERKPV